MWITDKTVVKPAYKQVFAYNVGDGNPTWAPITLPQKICAVTPGEVGRRQGRRGLRERQQRPRHLQPVAADRPEHRQEGWSTKLSEGELFDSTISINLSVTGKTLMVGRSQSGVAYDIDTGRKMFDKKRYGAPASRPGSRAAPG